MDGNALGMTMYQIGRFVIRTNAIPMEEYIPFVPLDDFQSITEGFPLFEGHSLLRSGKADNHGRPR